MGRACFSTSTNGKDLIIMKDIDLFQMALGLTPPWKVSSSDFDASTDLEDAQADRVELQWKRIVN